MALLEAVAQVSRPLRRRLTPLRFKETYIKRALATRPRPTTYLEIGVREGESLRLAGADHKIGIDPVRTRGMASLQEGEQYFECTSDTFFSEYASRVLEPQSIDVALVDGLHEFRHALRDILNLEPYMKWNGVIILDDCNPSRAERGSDRPTGAAWNGDVWKVAALLLGERFDINYATIDADEGVGVMTGFGSASVTPSQEVIERYKRLPYESLAADRRDMLNLVPPSHFDSLLPRS